MIRLGKYLYIHILTVVLFVVCIVIGRAKLLCVTYLVMLIHETAHTASAFLIGLKASHITIYPFGVNLKLKNKIIYSVWDEIILYLSGPMCNAVFALLALYLNKTYQSDELYFFYLSNTMLFVMNMLPALPLDGGFALKRLLVRIAGNNTAHKIMTVTTAVVSIFVFAAGAYVLYATKFNFSVILFAILILGNMFTQNEKYDIDFVKELMFYKKKNTKRIKHMITKNRDYKDMIKHFDKSGYNVVYITDDDGKITDIVTETQVINQLTDTNVTSY